MHLIVNWWLQSGQPMSYLLSLNILFHDYLLLFNDLESRGVPPPTSDDQFSVG